MKELNKMKELFNNFVKEAELLIKKPKQLELEEHNFRVDSYGWKKITVDEEEYLENPKKDIWEILNEEARGEQLFTFEAMQRETKKAGKTVPTNEQLAELLKEKEDMPNFVFAGRRLTIGSFINLSSYAYFWSSSISGSNAWLRFLTASKTTVYRTTYDQANGFSARCLKDNKVKK